MRSHIDHEFRPGDQALVRIPAMAQETDRVWCYILKKAAPDGKICAVIDAIAVVNKNPDYQPGSVIVVEKEKVLQVIPVDPGAPTLKIVICDGSLQEILRVDGKTAPIHIRIDQDDAGQVYEVDHRRFREVD